MGSPALPGVLVGAALLTLAACSAQRGSPDDSDAKSSPSDNGAAIASETTPRRIVSLAPSLTDLLFRLGVGDQIVGVTRYCDSPAAARALPKIGGVVDPSFEAIIALRPTLVMAIEGNASAPILAKLAGLGVGTLAIRSYDLPETYAGMMAVGRRVGRLQRAAQMVSDMKSRIAAIAARTRNRGALKVLVAYGHRPLVVAGPGSFADELLALLEVTNVAADAKVSYPKYSFEAVLQAAPDVIIDAYMGEDQQGDDAVQKFWTAYSTVPAVRSGRVHWAGKAGILQPGPRLVEGVDWLARTLFPTGPASAASATSQHDTGGRR